MSTMTKLFLVTVAAGLAVWFLTKGKCSCQETA